jgi:hypothetical protein
MMAIPRNEETEAIARRVIWFDPPEKSLADPVRLMAYPFTYAMHEDMKVLTRHRASSIHAHRPIGTRNWGAGRRRPCPCAGFRSRHRVK